MSSLEFSFAIFMTGGQFAGVDQMISVEVEACGGESKGILAKFILMKALFSHGGVSFGMNIFSLDGRNIASIAGNGCILRLSRILDPMIVTLLWKCAYDDLYIWSLVHCWKALGSIVLLL